MERKMDVKEAMDKLIAAVDTFGDSATFKRFLKNQSKFHRYSPRNIALIFHQKPNAEHVAGYSRWQSLGRQVKKGEHGIVILAPRPYTDKEKTNKDGTPKKGIYFTLTKVFDISQTEPIEGHPNPFNPDTEPSWKPKGETDLYDYLVDVVTSSGVPVRVVDGADGAAGYYSPTTHEIAVVKNNSAAMASVLLHEWAHSRLHYTGAPNADDPRDEKEVMVESITYILSQVTGVQSFEEESSLIYITTWLKNDKEKFVKALTTVQKEAHAMIELIEKGGANA